MRKFTPFFVRLVRSEFPSLLDDLHGIADALMARAAWLEMQKHPGSQSSIDELVRWSDNSMEAGRLRQMAEAVYKLPGVARHHKEQDARTAAVKFSTVNSAVATGGRA